MMKTDPAARRADRGIDWNEIHNRVETAREKRKRAKVSSARLKPRRLTRRRVG